jgi:hypothetical protein
MGNALTPAKWETDQMQMKVPKTPTPSPLPVIDDETQRAAARTKMASILTGGKNTTTNGMGFSGSAANPSLLGTAGGQIRSSIVTG